VFSASLRAASLNTRLARLAAHTIEKHGGTVDLAAMEIFDCPSMFSLAQAHQALGADDRIVNEQLSGWFERTIVAFMDLVEAAKHYPCIKKAWVEFLGELPNAATERVE
jgi:hypothetical protein